MTRSLFASIIACVAVAGFLFGCRETRDELAIRLARQRYEKWLSTQLPFLASLPPSVLHNHEFSTIQDGTTIRPVIDYHLKAGNWDGLINLSFVIEVDARYQPTEFKEQRITFIALPAGQTVPAEEGRQRNIYYGLKLPSAEMPAIVARVVRGDDFDDLRTQSAQAGEWVVSKFSDTDDWTKLKSE